MADAITEAQDLIKSAIAAIDEEAQSLSAALDSLNGGRSLKPQRPSSGRRSAAPKVRKGTKRTAKPSRRVEVIAAIDRKPGITGAGLAEQLGIPVAQVDSICETLVKEKMVRKRGVTYEMLPGAKAEEAHKKVAAA